MLKIIWLSDLHFAAQGDVLGHDPRTRLQAAIQHINAHHSDAKYCVISGDLVNRGTDIDYRALQSELSALLVPVFPMVGNHDDRAILRTHFKIPKNGMDTFVQYSIETPDGVLICLDTQKTGVDAGEFCAERRDWLEAKLQSAGETPVYLFMHHPPIPLGLPMQDQDRMEDGDGFLELVSAYPAVKYMFFGHVHRPISGTVKGIPFTTMRSVLYQAPAPLPAWDWTSFNPPAEAPNLGVVTISGTDVLVQYDQFCTYDVGIVD